MIDNLMPDIPRLYTAIAEWLACMLFILPLKRRFGRCKTIGIMIISIMIQSVFLIATGDLIIYFWIPCMVAAVILMIAFIYGCCDINVLDAAYFGMIAFVVAEFMASVEWQILCFFWKGAPSAWIQAIMLGVIYGSISVLLFRLIHVHLPKDAKMNISPKEYFSGLLIAVAVFAVSNMSYLTVNTPFSGKYSFEVGNIRTLVDLGGIAILYAHLIQCCELRVRAELEAVQNVLQNQYVQYKQSRESIELINYKYHDLKHQIAFLRSENDPAKREEFLDRMEEEIRQYEAQNKTGNQVLDTVLTTKSLYCAKHGITFTCVADGTLLDFMDVMDAVFAYEDMREGLAAGTDLWLNTDATLWKLSDAEMTNEVVNDMQRAAKNVVYAIAGSNAMNGLAADSKVVSVVPLWKKGLYALDVVAAIGILITLFFTTRSVIRKRKQKKAEESRKLKHNIKLLSFEMGVFCYPLLELTKLKQFINKTLTIPD